MQSNRLRNTLSVCPSIEIRQSIRTTKYHFNLCIKEKKEKKRFKILLR